MRVVIILVLLFTASFSVNTFGQSRIVMEKEWIVSCPDSGCGLDFEGILVVNGSNQKVISITTDPGMELAEDENGEIHVIYNGTLDHEEITLKATATVDVDYDTNILADPPLTEERVNATNLTEWNDGIAEEADGLAVRSSALETIRNAVEWVYGNIEYDISYFGQNRDAKTVYAERRGVCVEYSHLLISMLNYLGIETRYVNGYVLAENVQSHAWVEAYVPGYGWLPLDPTFRQAGVLDSSHVIVSYGLDQKTDYDRMVSNSASAMLTRGPVNLTIINMEKDAKGISVEITFDNQSYLSTSRILNGRNDYVFGLYSFYPPVGYGEIESELLLLSPGEAVVKNHRFDPSLFAEGYVYTLPLRASVNDANASKTVVVSREKVKTEKKDCALAMILVLIPLLAVIKFAYK